MYILLFVFAATSAVSQTLISAAQTKAHLNKSSVQIISARKASDFEKVHLPGAIHVDHTKLYNDGSILKSPSEVASILAGMGVSSNKKIIIYDDGSMKYSGRLYWIFSYLGVKEVSIVDGGMKAWRIARLPVTKNPTPIKKGSFTANVNSSVFADISLVKKAQNSSSYIIVDVRTPEEYKGTGGTAAKKGHIPGAINLPYEDVLNTNGTLKSSADLKALFAKHNISSSKTIILYCETSVRAGIVFTALKEVLNYPNVRVYDGAYTEWQKSSPVELGE